MTYNYIGIWNASTNSPVLTDGTGTIGNTYIVTMNSGLFITNINLGIGLRSVAAYTYITYDGAIWQPSLNFGGGGGSGTVTSFSTSGLSTLFTTAVSNPTTTPNLVFSPIAETQNRFFASPDGSPGIPQWRSLVVDDFNSGTGASATTFWRGDGTWAQTSGSSSGGVTSVNITPGTGIAASGGPITSSGAILVTNTLPDLTVTISGGTGISATGTYPNFIIANTSISTSGTVTQINTTAPITGGPITNSGTIGITQATSGTSGYLSASDWIKFNSSQTSGSYITALSGDVVATGPGSVPATIQPNVVTYGKMQPVSTTNRLLGSNATTTPVQEIVLGANLSLTGNVLNASATSGTVTQFSTSGLSTLFTTSVANPTTTPNLTFSPISEPGNLFFASPNSTSGIPLWRAITAADIAFSIYQSILNTSGSTVYVPYTGATTNVVLGSNSITATKYITNGGTSSQFVKGDGSLDSTQYLTSGITSTVYVPYTGATGAVNLGSNSMSMGTTNINVPTTTTGILNVNGNLIIVTSGATAITLTNSIIDTESSANNYLQHNIRNTSNGNNASSDYIATADTGTDSLNYIDFGINNSGFSQSGWTINGALDGYLFTQSGNLAIGTVATKVVDFFTGGTLAANRRLRMDANGNFFLYSFAGPGGVFYGSTTNQLLQTTSGTSSQVLLGGTTPVFGTLSATSGITGIVQPGNGGTGIANSSLATLSLSANSYNFITSGSTTLTLPVTGEVLTNTVTRGLRESISFNDITSSIGNNTYTLDLYAEYAYSVNELKILSGSGTCTAAMQINGVNITGISSISVTTSLATGTATGANSVIPGNKLTLVLSSTASLNNLQATILLTRNS